MIKAKDVKKRVSLHAQEHASNGGLRVASVAAALNLKPNSVRGALIALEKEGLVERVALGLYRWRPGARVFTGRPGIDA